MSTSPGTMGPLPREGEQAIQKLIFATLSVVLLVLFVLGRREAVVVGNRCCAMLVLMLVALILHGLHDQLRSRRLRARFSPSAFWWTRRHRDRGSASSGIGGRDRRRLRREAIPRAATKRRADASPECLMVRSWRDDLMAFVRAGLMGPDMRPILGSMCRSACCSRLMVALVVMFWSAL